MARESGLRIGSFAGAPVLVEPTFLLLALYVVGSAVLRGGAGEFVSALIFVGVIFAAIIIHEFGHAAMAAALKIPSRRIVLTFFGGYVQFASQPKHGWQEIAVSAAGPGANLASYVLVASLLPLLAPTMAPEGIGFLNALNTFGVISLMLGLFNLLPGFPLDGGHILRAALSYIMQRNTARIVTAITGLLLAAALIAYAIWQELLWTVFIAGLLGLAAWAELRAAQYDRQRGASDTTSNA
ncbi:site-2 protease family protein [Terricaulis silvestris]|uniref:Zn-dependent protease n=1 Tax=Terricaulis silvestris TaxID=2686094 RepID=A0A6I6MFJ4_9CAUL|nr:site-2 protease family protein [Terricaulis silvestris]QGZ93230.1 Zn-dependent protease [Terricaulis silvestris]